MKQTAGAFHFPEFRSFHLSCGLTKFEMMEYDNQLQGDIDEETSVHWRHVHSLENWCTARGDSASVGNLPHMQQADERYQNRSMAMWTSNIKQNCDVPRIFI